MKNGRRYKNIQNEIILMDFLTKDEINIVNQDNNYIFFKYEKKS